MKRDKKNHFSPETGVTIGKFYEKKGIIGEILDFCKKSVLLFAIFCTVTKNNA